MTFSFDWNQGGAYNWPVSDKRQQPESLRWFVRMSASPLPYLELDLHRLTADEAITKLEAFLYEAYCASVPAVRVVHGKGTGMLRGTVRSWLPKQSLVKSFRSGWTWEGGDGVTIVELAD